MQAQALLRKAIRDTTAELDDDDDDDDEEDPDKQHKDDDDDDDSDAGRNKRSQRPTMLRRNSMICPSLRNHAL